MKNCPSCGSLISDTAQFCNVCGVRVQQAANMQQSYEQTGQQAAQQMQQAYGYDASGQQAAWQQPVQQMQQGYDMSAQQAAWQAAQQQPVQQMQAAQQTYSYDTTGQQTMQQQSVQQEQPGYGYDANAQQGAAEQPVQQTPQQVPGYGYNTNGQQDAQQMLGYEASAQQPAQQMQQAYGCDANAQQTAQQQPVQQQQQAYSYDTNGQQQPMQQTYGYDANAQQAAMQQQMQMQGGYNTTGGEAKLPDYSGMDEAQKEEVRDMVRRASAKALHRKAKRRTTILLVLLVLAAGAAAFVLGMKLHKKTPLYRKAAEKFLTAYCDGDVAAAEACCLEPCRSAVRTQVNAAASVISLYGDGAKMTYKIDEFVPYDEETVGRLQDALKQDYGYECDVSDVYIVKATLKMTADGNTETSEEQLLVIKTGKNWVVWYQ